MQQADENGGESNTSFRHQDGGGTALLQPKRVITGSYGRVKVLKTKLESQINGPISSRSPWPVALEEENPHS